MNALMRPLSPRNGSAPSLASQKSRPESSSFGDAPATKSLWYAFGCVRWYSASASSFERSAFRASGGGPRALALGGGADARSAASSGPRSVGAGGSPETAQKPPVRKTSTPGAFVTPAGARQDGSVHFRLRGPLGSLSVRTQTRHPVPLGLGTAPPPRPAMIAAAHGVALPVAGSRPAATSTPPSMWRVGNPNA